MSNKFKIKNDILTVQEFSKFLEFALKDQSQHQRLQIKMNLEILGTYMPHLNFIQRLIQKIKFYV